MINKCPSRMSCSSYWPVAIDSGECHQSLHSDSLVDTDDDGGGGGDCDFGGLSSMAASGLTKPHSSSSWSDPVYRPNRRNSFELSATGQVASSPVSSPIVDGRPSRRRGVASGRTCRVDVDWRPDQSILDMWRRGLPFLYG